MLWLEEYLTRWKKTLIVVSHDRDFLNTVTTDIIHLHDLKLHSYRSNFAQFEEMYEQKRWEVNKAAEKYEKQIKAAKKSGSKAAQDKVSPFSAIPMLRILGIVLTPISVSFCLQSMCPPA